VAEDQPDGVDTFVQAAGAQVPDDDCSPRHRRVTFGRSGGVVDAAEPVQPAVGSRGAGTARAIGMTVDQDALHAPKTNGSARL
jgi:hypothetical protein